ncbi:MAG: copper resistance protein B [Vicinamibacterales bacterium]
MSIAAIFTRISCAMVLFGIVSTSLQAQSSPSPDASASSPAQVDSITPIPPLTDADRRAAFPDVGQHNVGDRALHSYVLLDRLEWQAGAGPNSVTWDNMGWIGGDLHRIWFRTEGERTAGRLDSGQVRGLYGRAVARWWDVVAGIRYDVRPGPGQAWVAVGLQGLAPGWFDVEATAFIGARGRTQARLEAETDVLLTNRLMLQPRIDVEIAGKSDPEHGVGAGLSSLEAGLRLRYELRREVAPYVGVTWVRPFFGTAAIARSRENTGSGAKLAVGLRLWF